MGRREDGRHHVQVRREISGLLEFACLQLYARLRLADGIQADAVRLRVGTGVDRWRPQPEGIRAEPL